MAFAEYSLTSKNPKTIFTTGVVIFNLGLLFKGSKKDINPAYLSYLKAVAANLDSISGDAEGMTAVLLSECRILFNNMDLVNSLPDDVKASLTKAHCLAKIRCGNAGAKEAVDDFLSLIGE